MSNPIPRPSSLGSYICDGRVKNRMRDALTAAKKRGQLPPHMLFSGSPGTGKTTAAMVIVHELGIPVFKFVGCELRSPSQLRSILSAPPCGAVVFLDEIHAISRSVAETLYPIMEDGVMSGVGDSRISLKLPPLVVIGSTTEVGEMPRPLRDRFTLHFVIPEYTVEHMLEIARNQAKAAFSGVFEAEALSVIANATKRTPRLSGQIIRQVADYALANGIKTVTGGVASSVIARAGISAEGMDGVDMAVLRSLNDGPLGLESLASITGSDSTTLRDEHEPYLLRRGYIRRTGKGREITGAGRDLIKEGKL